MFEQLGQWVDTYGTTVVPRQARAPAALQPAVSFTRSYHPSCCSTACLQCPLAEGRGGRAAMYIGQQLC
jgi:hypothetical protein